MGLEQVDHFKVTSNVTSVIIGGGSGGSSTENFAINTDDVYLLTYHSLFMSVDGRVANIRYTKSSDNSPDTSSNYDQAWLSPYTNASFYAGSNTNSPHHSNNSMGTTLQESQVGMIYLYNFNNSSEYSFMTKEALNITETPEYTGMFKGGVLTVAQACNGIQFVANGNAIASGTFTLYRMT